MVKKPRIVFLSGQMGRLTKDGVSRSENRDYNFKWTPVNSLIPKVAKGIPKSLVSFTSQEKTDDAPVEGCYFVWADTSGSRVTTIQVYDTILKQLESKEIRAMLAEGESARLRGEVKKAKETSRASVEEDVDFHKKLRDKTRPRTLGLPSLRKVRTITTPEEDEEEELEEEE